MMVRKAGGKRPDEFSDPLLRLQTEKKKKKDTASSDYQQSQFDWEVIE